MIGLFESPECTNTDTDGVDDHDDDVMNDDNGARMHRIKAWLLAASQVHARHHGLLSIEVHSCDESPIAFTFACKIATGPGAITAGVDLGIREFGFDLVCGVMYEEPLILTDGGTSPDFEDIERRRRKEERGDGNGNGTEK